MEFIREFASQKYHIADPGFAKKPICRKRRFKYLQLSIVPTPPCGMVCQKCRAKLVSQKREGAAND